MGELTNWYQANSKSLLQEIERVRKILEYYIESKENQPSLTELVSDTSALTQLCLKFNLSSFERDILLLCVGMEIEPNFQSLCAKAQGNSPNKNYPTLSLALAVFSGASWGVLSPQSPLQYWQLLQIEPGLILTQSPLRLDKGILCYLLGEKASDEQLAEIVKPISPQTNVELLSYSQEKLVEQLINIWSSCRETNSFPILQLSRSERNTKCSIASVTCQRLGFNLQTISARVIPTNPQELNQLCRRWEREAILSNSVLLLDCDRPNFIEPGCEEAICQFIESINTPLILSTNERKLSCQRPFVNFDIPPLSHEEQKALWETHLGEAGVELNGEIESLAAQFNLNSSNIQAACYQFKIQNKVLGKNEKSKLKIEESPQPTPKNNSSYTDADSSVSPSSYLTQLWNFCRLHARNQLDDLAQHINATASWDDLVLPTQQRQILSDIAAHLRQRLKVYQEWGFANKGDRGLGISALFYGASGTGKTMAAGVLANEFRLDLYRIDLSRVVSKYIGETEKNLRRIFDAAETGSAILLFDEADALFGKRTEVKDSHDRHANIEVSYLLQRMEAYQGLAILTTNFPSSLDSAFERRIRFVVEFPSPEAEGRTQIWQRVFPAQTPTQGLNYQRLGQLKVAGGNIRNIALNAAFLAAEAGEPVMMKHLLQAAQREYLKLKRLLTDEETRGWF